MANRTFQSLRGSLSREIVKLFGSFTIGASGAVDSVSGLRGFSVTKTATETGRYTLALEDAYQAFKGCLATVEQSADSAIAVLYAGVRNVDSQASGKTLDVQFVNPAGADTNPASGDVIHVEITLQNGEDI